MATIQYTLDPEKPLTQEQIDMLRKAEKMPIVFDEDSPELTEEDLDRFRRVSEIRRQERKKQNVTLRLSPDTLKKAKALGKGYTGILSRMIELVIDDPEIIQKCL